ncbi:uncharacterized protein Nmag_2113 [Natrialba magadii ATCC 43099]|uniref:Uncharacterized protein n=1 Tax=Natrialba magadii (strain ATCC 43099 / DSM 3394 / CCM 3739 / CIP 104546 / IAM 13178 / JCM 8861 / NBRC 102185 / NCIMB 2190 / MS3) TaxID=547559 RepID=D3SW21_NATMM|nr:hypothetical protein [Natrialba magadii]ADD05682.1 uncharacterized protein Nmag_2113 [Natrialba magadii ATCC 43099]ELY29907.1 hypothetical protein C500_09864 [Natrialba magadii ATCC 43099]
MRNDAPTADDRWTELLTDANAIAAEYDDDGWESVVLEPSSVSPSEAEERFGLNVSIDRETFEQVEAHVADSEATFGDAEVYYLPVDEDGTTHDDSRRFALAVERDADNSIAVFVPVTYTLPEAKTVFETALLEEQLLLHVRATDADETDPWVTFSHDDPSLFLSKSDVQSWEFSPGE